MLTVAINATLPRRWWRRNGNRQWLCRLPQCWADVPEALRQRYFAQAMQGPAGMVAILREQSGKLPWWAVRRMNREDLAVLTTALNWMLPRQDCVDFPLQSFTHNGTTYHLPSAKGQNLCCLEYPLADEYYMRYVHDNTDVRALTLLLATIARPEEPDAALALIRADKRAPLHSRAEVEARADDLADAPAEVAVAALMFFGGLKEYIHRVYSTWLFEEQDDDDDADENGADENETDETTNKPATTATNGPDFGWWGIFQQVAESGVFGNLKQVYQASLHDVCIYLVRQRVKAQQERNAMRAAAQAAKNRY